MRARRALRRLLDRGSFDAMVCHQSWPHVVFGPVAAAKQIPLVLWLHMASEGHWLDRLAWRVRPDMVICNSHFTASTVPRDCARVEVVYYAIEPAAAQPEVTRLHDTPEREVVIIQVSRMERLKGQITCLDALGQLRDQSGWTCWQVGGAQRAEEQRVSCRASRTRAPAGNCRSREISRPPHPMCGSSRGRRHLLPAQPAARCVRHRIRRGALCGLSRRHVRRSAERWRWLTRRAVCLSHRTIRRRWLRFCRRLIADPGRTRAARARGARPRAAGLCDPRTQVPRIADVIGTVAGVAAHG